MMLSDSYTVDEVMFEWKRLEKPVQVREGLTLPEFNVTDTAVGDCTAGYNTGVFLLLYHHKNSFINLAL